jgi:hypothetical protein
VNQTKLNQAMKLLSLFLIILLSPFIWVGCTADHEEALIPGTDPCDTTLVRYATQIAPIMSASCNNCHSATTPLGGINTASYAGLSAVAANGRLKGAVNHSPGFSPMPQGQQKLDSCSIKRINAWINQGYPNN